MGSINTKGRYDSHLPFTHRPRPSAVRAGLQPAMRWVHGADGRDAPTLGRCALRSIAGRYTMRCHNCGHSVGQYSGGYVWGRPFCGTHLPAELATWHHLNLGAQTSVAVSGRVVSCPCHPTRRQRWVSIDICAEFLRRRNTDLWD